MPHLVVPQVAGDEPWQPEPTHEVVLVASSVLPKRVQRTPQRRNAGDVALREPRRQTVEEKVGRSWRLSSRRGTPSGRGHLTRADAAIEAAGEDRGSERFQVRLARRSAVEWLEPLGCIEQQRRSVAAAPEREHDLGAQASEPRALKLVQRAHSPQPPEAPARPPARRTRTSPALRRAPADRVGPNPGSARPLARGTRPLRRCRREPARARPSAPARRPRARRDPKPRARDATRADRDRPRDRSPRPARGAPPGGPARAPPGRPPSAPAGDGTARGHRSRSTRRSAPVLRRPLRARARRPRATARSCRPPARPRPSAAVAGCRPGATRAGAGSSARSGSQRRRRREVRIRPRALPASMPAATRAGRAGCRAPRRRRG